MRSFCNSYDDLMDFENLPNFDGLESNLLNSPILPQTILSILSIEKGRHQTHITGGFQSFNVALSSPSFELQKALIDPSNAS